MARRMAGWVLWAAATAAFLAATPCAAQDQTGKVRLFGGIAGSVTSPFQSSSQEIGFGVGAQWDIGPWFGVWGMASYQPPEALTDTPFDWGAGSLEYELRSMALTVGGVVRLNVAALADPPKDWIARVLTSFEMSFGPLVGMAGYFQTPRGESERRAWVPLAGMQLEMGIWFLDWLGLRFAGDFGWSLTRPIGDGDEGLLRTEVFFGPMFRL